MRIGFIGLMISSLAGCQPFFPGGSGPAAHIVADGAVDCAEDAVRQEFNMCPAERPLPGTDAEGVTWSLDRLFGIVNPLHAPLECLRGTSAELGESSYQCCYDGDLLVNEGDRAGTFDFVSPAVSLLRHYLFDVLPSYRCPPAS
jgi:hypothetical protein